MERTWKTLKTLAPIRLYGGTWISQSSGRNREWRRSNEGKMMLKFESAKRAGVSAQEP